jgi:predicted DNA-binding WGR domain protein
MRNTDKFWGYLTPVMLRRIRPEHNERRFYVLGVGADLFGNVVLTRYWGRIGTGGKQRIDQYGDFAGAAENLNKLAQQKRRRGYVDYNIAHLDQAAMEASVL